jgi:hypothetical protein
MQKQNKIAVYTSIFGDIDDPKVQPPSEGVDYILFTDKHKLAEGIDVRVAEPKFDTPRMSAKWYKIFPHLCLSEYRYTIFLDGSLQITNPNFAYEAIKYIGEDGIGIWKHPDRNDVIEESQASKPMIKYSNTLVLEQAQEYDKEGLPRNNGLYCTGTIVRDNHNPRMREAMDLYMKEIEKWTYQDQISFPYVVWKLGLKISTFPESIGNFDKNNWFYRIPHYHDK